MDLGAIGAIANNTKRQKKRPKYENANNENAFFSIDDALDFAGDNSKYQKRVNNIFSFQYAIYSFLLMGFPLMLVKPIFSCKAADGSYYPCTEKEACELGRDNFKVQESGEITLTAEFDLYCDRSYIAGLLGSLIFTGSFLAFLFFPYFGNWKGRKMGIALANVMCGLSALVIAFAQDIWIVMISLILCGFAYSGFEILCFAYTSELSGERFRNFSIVTLGTVWAIAQIIIAPVFLFAGYWRNVFLYCMAIPLIISIWPNIKLVYETPRFLNSKERYDKAREVINNICAINERPPFRARLYGEIEFENKKAATFFSPKKVKEGEQPKAHNSGYLDLFIKPQYRKITLILLYVWFFRNFTYFGLNYSLPELGTEVYQNFTLTAIFETLANLSAAQIKFKVARIKSMYISTMFVTLSCLLIYFVPIPHDCFLEQARCYQKTFSVIFAVIAKFSVALFANILVTYTSELYPTEVRSLGLGLTLTASRIGAVAMPFLVTYLQDKNFGPLVSFGFMGILAFLLIITCLPETHGLTHEHEVYETKKTHNIEMREKGEPLLKHNDTHDSL